MTKLGIPEKYRDYIKDGYDILMMLFFAYMVWQCTHTEGYQIIDIDGSVMTQEEVADMFNKCNSFFSGSGSIYRSDQQKQQQWPVGSNTTNFSGWTLPNREDLQS